MASSFRWDPILGRTALAAWSAAPAGARQIPGDELAHGAMTLLVNAEMLAAQAGIVPWATTPDGERAVIAVGGARDKIDAARAAGAVPERWRGVDAIYLAAHGAVRRAHVLALPTSAPAPIGSLTIPAIVGLTVAGVAALIAGAWYLERREQIQIDGANLRAAARVDGIVALGRAELTATGAISPGTWRALEAEAAYEAPRSSNGAMSWAPWAIGAGVVVVGGAYLAGKLG